MRRLLLALVILLALALPLAAEAPLSLEEARAALAARPEEAAEDIVALDAIERAIPTAFMPLPVFIFTGRKVGLSWAGPLKLTVAGRLEYALTLPTSSAPLPRARAWPYVAVGVAGVVVGAVMAGLIR